MRTGLAAGLLALYAATASVASATEPLDPEVPVPVVLRADELTYDRDQGLIVASGNVEIAQGERILLADRLTYNQLTDAVTATGNVSLLEPSGDVVFASHFELSDQMKNGIARDIRILLADESRFAANGAVRTDGTRTEMTKAVFSPCRLCPEHPDRPPLWQIKAERVVHDQERQNIVYRGAVLEFFGIPVAYTPYFTHPDPTVERRSGFLAPIIGSSSQLGLTMQTPYYFDLGPHRDATFAPIFTTDEGVVLTGEYRQRTQTGKFEFAGSITRPERRNEEGDVVEGREVRGHIDGSGQFDLGDTWRWGFQAERASDDTYLNRYRFSSADTLTSRLYLEGSRGGSYAAINGYAFQGLATCDDPDETPLVLPIAEYKYLSEPGALGGRFSLDANVMALTHSAGSVVDKKTPCPTVVGSGASVRRFSISGGWSLPYLGRLGDIYTLSATLRGDLYWVDEVTVNPTADTPRSFSGVTGRIFPQIALDWRYPWVRQTGTVRQVIEPVAQLALSPYGGNPDKIPNEDSKGFEFDDTNLFSLTRFPGLDRVDGGPRLSYGLRVGVYGASGGRTTAFIGQSIRPTGDDDFSPSSGLAGRVSDFVGRIVVSPSKYLDLSYRFRLGQDDLSVRRSEIDLTAGPDWLRVKLGFLSLDEAPAEEDVGKRQEINVSGFAALGPNWSLTGRFRRDLTNGNTLRAGGGIAYEDECLFFGVEVSRRFITPERDIGEGTSVRFTVRLRQLG